MALGFGLIPYFYYGHYLGDQKSKACCLYNYVY